MLDRELGERGKQTYKQILQQKEEEDDDDDDDCMNG